MSFQSGRPRQQHPAVQALLLAATKAKDDEGSSTNVKNNKESAIQQPTQSSKIRKLSQTLTWRSAHVKSPNYSLTIPTCLTTTSSTILSIRQVQTEESDLYGTGAMVWPASLVLVKYLEWTRHIWMAEIANFTNSTNDNERSNTITVADLGAGTGVTSLGLALLFNARGKDSREELSPSSALIVCTDGCDLVVNLAEENVQRAVEDLKNDSQSQITASTAENDDGERKTYLIGNCEMRLKKYLWGDGTIGAEFAPRKMEECSSNMDSIQQQSCHYDMILISDCVLPKLYPIAPLVDAIDELSGQKTVTYITYEARYYPEYDPKKYFCRLAEEKGFEVKVIPMEDQHPDYSVEDIEVWEVRRNTEA